MPILSYDTIISNLEKEIKGVYLLYGDEDYFINNIVNFVKDKYKFNINIYFADNCDIKDIFNNVYQQSIFYDFRVILIKNTELNKFINDKNNVDYIRNYVDNFSANAILMLTYNKNIPKNNNVITSFEKAFIFNSKKLLSYQIKSFIKNYSREKNIDITNEVIDKIYDCYSDNLNLIKTVIDNVNFNNISYFRDFNLFEFINYVSLIKKDKLINAVNFTKINKNDIFPLLGMIFNFFLKFLAYLHSNNKKLYHFSYQNASRLYNNENILEILNKTYYFDCCLKGIKCVIFNYKHTFQYLTSTIINIK